MVKLGKKILKHELFWLSVIILVFVLIIFRKYIFSGLYPIPGDILTGLYYPWFDYKWGYATPVPVKNNLPSDIISILYPWRILGIRLIKSGILPLWDSTILFGTPLLANFQAALLNPLNLLFFVFDELNSWSIQVVLQPVLMIVFMYLFLRDLKLSKYSSIFGGILYAFSGYSIVWMEYNSINFTLAYLPLLLFFTRKILYDLKIIWVFSLAITLCFQVFSGYPQSVLFSLFCLVFYYFYLVLSDRKFKLINFGLLITGIISGFLLSAVQLIPSVELYKNSTVGLDTVALSGGIKYLPLSHFITLFFPDFYGNPVTGNYWSTGSYDNFAFSISAVGVFFVIILFSKGKLFIKKNLYFIYLGLLAIIFATKNPLTEFVTQNDIFGFGSNVNTRVMFVFVFSVSVLASFGFEYYLKEKIRFWQKILPLLFFCIISVLIFFVFIKTNGQSGLNWIDGLLSNEDTIVGFRNMVIPLGTIVLIFFLSFINNKKAFIYLVFLVLLFSVVRSTDKYLSFTKKELMYPNVEVTDYLQGITMDSRFEKEIGNLLMPPNTWTLYGLQTATGQNVSTLLSTGKYLSLLNHGKYQEGYINRFNEITNTHSPLINTLNISHYLFIKWNEQGSPSTDGSAYEWLVAESFRHKTDIGSVSIYENAENLGLVWFPKNVICENDESNVGENITRDNYDAGQEVFVNCMQGVNYTDIDGSVNLLEKSSNKMTFETKSNKDGFVVVSSAFFPGWMVSIDNSEFKTVYSANTALIAVSIPEGEHQVDLVYKPKSFNMGLSVTVLSATVWILILMRKKSIIKK